MIEKLDVEWKDVMKLMFGLDKVCFNNNSIYKLLIEYKVDCLYVCIVYIVACGE